jgi:hypothetical protein
MVFSPARLCSLTWGYVRQPYAGVDFIPQSGVYEFGYLLLYVNYLFLFSFNEVLREFSPGLVIASFLCFSVYLLLR